MFKNNTKYPIKVVAGYANSICEIWGTKTDNITVKFVNEVLSATVRTTPSRWYSAVTEEGENGSKVQTYRWPCDGDGKRISRTKESFSVYTRRNQVAAPRRRSRKRKNKKTDKKKNEQKQDTDQTAG